ncbi:hypothetical protein M0802_012573 [Mischocyttarus mexicanus]|nr:hypothetical protein M0802_012573 [Mischocyttarus mexicanus]
MSQEQRRIRPDTPVIEEAMIEHTSRLSDMDSAMRKKMEEIMNIQDLLTISKTQEETLKKQEELTRSPPTRSLSEFIKTSHTLRCRLVLSTSPYK